MKFIRTYQISNLEQFRMVINTIHTYINTYIYSERSVKKNIVMPIQTDKVASNVYQSYFLVMIAAPKDLRGTDSFVSLRIHWSVSG